MIFDHAYQLWVVELYQTKPTINYSTTKERLTALVGAA
jgi:hypothetical protein